MILQALVRHYETLAESEKVSRPGWCHAKVSFAISLSKDGRLKGILPLKHEEERGKKAVWLPTSLEVPQMVARSSGVSANFLCDNSKYMLGIDSEGSADRVKERFEAAKIRHLEILKDVECEMAVAIKNFFQSWEPEKAEDYPELQDIWDEITEGGNLIFSMGLQFAQDDAGMREIWNQECAISQGEEEGICLVTGEKTEIARLHGPIKGVQGAQSSGAALVSFNASAFGSYGKEQSYNAPVGTYAVFGYTTALNYLLSQKEYVFQLGDAAIVFWAQEGEETYQEFFSWCVEPKKDNQEAVSGVFKALKERRAIDVDGLELNKEQKFYILGLAPNAARLSVRFFYEDSFGNILKHIQKHYDRMKIVKPSWVSDEYLGLWKMLQETVNQKSKDKKPVPHMAAMTFQAILSGNRYPESLFGQTMIRIRAEQGKVTYGRAAIIKAYLIRNCGLEKGDEFVGLNQECKNAAYVLGRVFSVLEAIQEEANPGINATIRDRYFNAACATPATVFPILIKLKNSHIRKIDRQKEAAKVYYEKILTALLGMLDEYPRRLTLQEQGKFILGYYHQVQKRFEKKEEK